LIVGIVLVQSDLKNLSVLAQKLWLSHHIFVRELWRYSDYVDNIFLNNSDFAKLYTFGAQRLAFGG
jgi:hypothetical protein